MDIIELFIDENDESLGIEAISIVDKPAIDEDFVALSKQKIEFAEVDKEKKILLGPALIPNKPIFRKSGDKEYYIYFSKSTVKKASELFFIRGNQNNATLEHQLKLKGMSVVESWIVEGENDKSKNYGLDMPEGTWMVAMKVLDDEVWENFVKTKKVKGFSIEGYFADKLDSPQDRGLKSELAEYEDELLVEELRELLSAKRVALVSYNDYPDSAVNNAKKAIEYNKEVGNKCMTQVGKVRARQISKKAKLSEQVLVRVRSYLERAEVYYDEKDKSACGTIAYLAWGGLSMKRYVNSKLKSLGYEDLQQLETQVVDDTFAIIDDRLAYSSVAKAIEISKDLGCQGFHVHELEGKKWYMPCEQHSVNMRYKCPKGYKKDYKKHKCVKMSAEELAEIGPRGGIRKSPKAPRSGTPNPNPKGKGTAKGDASTSRGAKVSQKDLAALQKKADDFNKRYKKKLGYGTTVGQLKAVFQRGLGAFNTSHSPRIKSPTAWAQARVNAYLYLIRNGRPQNPKYTGDFDLLPAKHPKSNKK